MVSKSKTKDSQILLAGELIMVKISSSFHLNKFGMLVHMSSNQDKEVFLNGVKLSRKSQRNADIADDFEITTDSFAPSLLKQK